MIITLPKQFLDTGLACCERAASNQMDALTLALQISLGYVFEGFFEYYAVLEPNRVDKVRKMLGVKTPKQVNVDPLMGEVLMCPPSKETQPK